MDFGLSSSVIKKLQEVFESFPEVNKVVIYGSRAKGNFREGSDIDLTLFGENLDLKKLQKIELEIDELYLPYKLDLSLFHQISNLDLIEHINRVGKIFYQKEKTTSN
jgi:predicted nucleotidyltransferase